MRANLVTAVICTVGLASALPAAGQESRPGPTLGDREGRTGLDRPRSVEYRDIEGVGNNIANPDWGATDTDLIRLSFADYADGISEMGGAGRPSARKVTNQFHQGRTPKWSERVLTSMIFHWGQFIDHDLDLTDAGTGDLKPIDIPLDDAWLAPGGTIPFARANFNASTGTDALNPREQVNEITSYLDASMVYGSTHAVADALREGAGGRLLLSGGFLPLNSLGVPMANQFGVPEDELFAAGDVRANEQPGLTALHTLFVREHNRLADEFAAANPAASDEEIYQHARALVGAMIQNITYSEFLPALGVSVPAYSGYDDTVNATIANEFSAGSYRFGHTMVNPTLPRFSDHGTVHPSGPLDLFESFFNPDAVTEAGIEPIIHGQFKELAQEIDPFIVDDLRNLLFGAGGIGVDLGSFNIQRGRDHGIPSMNAVRAALSLPVHASFLDVTGGDADLAGRLASAYADVNEVDLWIGGLCEPHLAGSSLGETHHAVIANQFIRTRDGDRFWYENHLSVADAAFVEASSLAEVIRRNTSIGFVQDSVFFISADFTQDAVLDFADLMAFLTAFNAQDPAADIAANGAFEYNDVIAFLRAFQQGLNP